MEIVKDKDLIYDVCDFDIVLIGTTIKNTMGNGFQKKVARSFKYVYESNAQTQYDDIRKLGTLRAVQPLKEGFPIFILCYITKGRFQPYIKPDALEYDALKHCLHLVAEHFPDKKIASTIMGVSEYEGGGDKEKVLKIFNEECNNIDITLYDYEQVNYKDEDNHIYGGIMDDYNNGVIDKDEYYRRKSKFLWEKHFGLYTPYDTSLSYREIQKIVKNGNKDI